MLEHGKVNDLGGKFHFVESVVLKNLPPPQAVPIQSSGDNESCMDTDRKERWSHICEESQLGRGSAVLATFITSLFYRTA